MIIIKIGITITIYYMFIILFVFIKTKADFRNNKVVKAEISYWAEAFQILLHQLSWIRTKLTSLFHYWKMNLENNARTLRKANVLTNTVNHINVRLEEDINLKMVASATTDGINVWVYLANNLDDGSKSLLEDYFRGVLSKYNKGEFALDYMTIDVNSGAGWVAKFDVKTMKEATYNRSARASDVELPDDEERDGLW